jgi:hypothetical protein
LKNLGWFKENIRGLILVYHFLENSCRFKSFCIEYCRRGLHRFLLPAPKIDPLQYRQLNRFSIGPRWECSSQVFFDVGIPKWIHSFYIFLLFSPLLIMICSLWNRHSVIHPNDKPNPKIFFLVPHFQTISD